MCRPRGCVVCCCLLYVCGDATSAANVDKVNVSAMSGAARASLAARIVLLQLMVVVLLLLNMQVCEVAAAGARAIVVVRVRSRQPSYHQGLAPSTRNKQ